MAEPIRSDGRRPLAKRARKTRELGLRPEYARRRELYEARKAEGLPDTEPAASSTLSQPLGTRSARYRGIVSRRAADGRLW